MGWPTGCDAPSVGTFVSRSDAQSVKKKFPLKMGLVKILIHVEMVLDYVIIYVLKLEQTKSLFLY